MTQLRNFQIENKITGESLTVTRERMLVLLKTGNWMIPGTEGRGESFVPPLPENLKDDSGNRITGTAESSEEESDSIESYSI